MVDELEMRRFTKEQLAELRLRLSDWTPLETFANVVDEVQQTAGFYAVSQGGLKLWREAWVAVSCGQLSQATRVRVGADPPDFELDYGDHQRKFEIVDILPAEWKLGRTYDDYAEQWNASRSFKLKTVGGEAEQNALPQDLEEQLQAKADKDYERPLILVADIHHELIPWTDFPVERHLTSIAARYLSSFDEIWLRRGAHLLRVTPRGATRLAFITPPED